MRSPIDPTHFGTPHVGRLACNLSRPVAEHKKMPGFPPFSHPLSGQPFGTALEPRFVGLRDVRGVDVVVGNCRNFS